MCYVKFRHVYIEVSTDELILRPIVNSSRIPVVVSLVSPILLVCKLRAQHPYSFS